MDSQSDRKDNDVERISVRDANQGFSKLIARVEKGERFVVTKNNKEVARIEPADTDQETRENRRLEALARIDEIRQAAKPSKDGWTYKGKRHLLHDRSV